MSIGTTTKRRRRRTPQHPPGRLPETCAPTVDLLGTRVCGRHGQLWSPAGCTGLGDSYRPLHRTNRERENQAIIAAAARELGLSQRQYRDRFGWLVGPARWLRDLPLVGP